MGTYINIGSAGFQSVLNGEYVDKSGLISIVNETLFTERRYGCVTRCRRFGKSLAAKMLCAYYDQSCDSRSLFSNLAIANDPSFEKHLNRYPVLFMDISDFVTRFNDDDIVSHVDAEVKADVHAAYPDVPMVEGDDLMALLIRINEATGQQFFFIIDEWDAICREFKAGTKAMDSYVSWLRRMFKGGSSSKVFAGVYMTGILPVKKYKTESAMNNFTEYSMVDPVDMGTFFGFTKDEVKALAEKHGMDYAELEKWYDGYQIGDELSMFNPNSVMSALRSRRCRSFWASTGAYDAVARYIKMDFFGLKDDVLRLLSGERVKVNTTKFQNDISVIRGKDDVLTALIHLGYLSFNWRRNECYVPNFEVLGELRNAVEDTGWNHVVRALEQSERLLELTLAGNAEAVARAIDVAHDEHTSILSYNDENSLACVLSIAYYCAIADYVVHREYASGKGFADLVLIPRRHVDSPAVVIELKYDKSADTAISQIKRREYPTKVAQYTDNLLLVGINYDRESKQHQCCIEKYVG